MHACMQQARGHAFVWCRSVWAWVWVCVCVRVRVWVWVRVGVLVCVGRGWGCARAFGSTATATAMHSCERLASATPRHAAPSGMTCCLHACGLQVRLGPLARRAARWTWACAHARSHWAAVHNDARAARLTQHGHDAHGGAMHMRMGARGEACACRDSAV